MLFTRFASSDVPSTWAWVLGFSPHFHHLMPPAQSHHDGRWCIAYISLPRRLHLHVRVQLERREVMFTNSCTNLHLLIEFQHRSWAITGGVMSDAVPTMIRFQDTRTSSHRPLSGLGMSHTETESTGAARTKNSDIPSSYTVTEFDSPVWRPWIALCTVYPLRFAFLSPFTSWADWSKSGSHWRGVLALTFSPYATHFSSRYLLHLSPSPYLLQLGQISTLVTFNEYIMICL